MPNAETNTAAVDPYTPAQMAGRLEHGGVAKAALDGPRTLVLGILAGAFIGLGGLAATIAGCESGLGLGPTRLLMGLAFSLGLILVSVGGAELFTGNALIVMAWAQGKVRTESLLKNWFVVYCGNFVGAVATAVGIWLTGVHGMFGAAPEKIVVAAALAKVSLPFGEALMRGVFCNALVCLAVWLCFSARTTTDKILCIVFPITTFVAAGLEHSIANMYFVPLAIFIQPDAGITWSAFLIHNLLPVTLGNIVGGSVMVGAVYWFVYLRRDGRG